MSAKAEASSRIVRAVHGKRQIHPDPGFEAGLSEALRNQFSREELIELYGRHVQGDGYFDRLIRRAIWRAVAKRVGHGLEIGPGTGFKHLETFEVGNGVFIGAQVYLQGRFDGRFIIGDHVWIGPQAYFDARDLVLGDYVGWGPAAKVLGSQHTAFPLDRPIIETDLEIKPVRVEDWADIGTNATLLPGITVGRGAIVGAGAVVTHDVPPFAVVAGVPARVVRWRDGQENPEHNRHAE